MGSCIQNVKPVALIVAFKRIVTCGRADTHSCTRTHAHARAHTHARAHAHTHTRAHTCTHTHTIYVNYDSFFRRNPTLRDFARRHSPRR